MLAQWHADVHEAFLVVVDKAEFLRRLLTLIYTGLFVQYFSATVSG